VSPLVRAWHAWQLRPGALLEWGSWEGIGCWGRRSGAAPETRASAAVPWLTRRWRACGLPVQVEAGEFTDSEIIVMLGENGTGKTTFIRMLAGMLKPDDHFAELPEFKVSYKPQKISPKFTSTVRNLLHKRIQTSYMHPQFVSDVMKPMQVGGNFGLGALGLAFVCLSAVCICTCFSVSLQGRGRWGKLVTFTETNRMHSVLFGIQNRTFGSRW
jgi:ABC transporter